jgi:hypothetical protein
MLRFRWLIPGAVLALSLTILACGGDDEETSNGDGTPAGETPSTNGDAPEGAWRGEFDTGTEVTLEIFVDPADVPELAEFEEFREAAGFDPVRYARVTAKNVTGAADTARFATLTGEDGEQFGDDAIQLTFACSSAYRWLPTDTQPTQDAVALYNELFAGTCESQELAGPQIAPGETVTYFLVYEGEGEPVFERVFMGLDQEFER